MKTPYIIPVLMLFAAAFMGLSVIYHPAHSQATMVDNEGYVTMVGEIESIGLDQLTLVHENGSTLVKFATMDDDLVQQLEDGDILQEGNVVEVYGQLDDDSLNQTIINAYSINIIQQTN